MAVVIPTPLFEARRARGHLMIGGQDILLGLNSTQILSFSYTDNTSDKADDLSISIADPGRTWMMRYLPSDAKRGTECQASISITNWRGIGDTRLFPCGKFWINHVGFKLFPNVVEVKATSIPTNGVKSEKKFRGWNNIFLKDLIEQIAPEWGLVPFMDTEQNPRIKRVEQKDKADLGFLREACKEAELCLKIHDGKMIVYSEEEYEARPPAFYVRYGEAQLLDANFDYNSDDTFAEAEEQYLNPETGKLTTEAYKAEGIEGTTAKLRVNEALAYEPDDASMSAYASTNFRANDQVDWSNDSPTANKGKGKGGKKRAKGKAKAKLKEKNKKEKKCSITTFGNVDYLSGLNFQTEGFGIFDKKWIIEGSSHEVQDGGYVTKLNARGTQDNY